MDGLTLPAVEYGRDLGCSVTGGYVYRGEAIPSLQGRYLYGDYCSGRIWRTTWNSSTMMASSPVEMTTDLQSSGISISSFGQDAAGEIYVANHQGGIVYRIDLE